MSQAVPPYRLDLTALDERAVPSTVTAVATTRPFEFTATGTLATANATVTEGGAVYANTASSTVTVTGKIDYSSPTAGQSGAVTFSGTGTGKEVAASAGAPAGLGDYAQTVEGKFTFKDDNGAVASTDPLTGTSKWTGATTAGTTDLGPRAVAGTFDVSTFKLTAGWNGAGVGPANGTLSAVLASTTPAATDVAFDQTVATPAADGGLGLQFTVKMTGDLVKAPTRDTAVARVTATWEGGGKSEAVQLDVPLYWNTGSVAVKVDDLDPPAWAESLTVRLDADGKLAEADEGNNTWTVRLAEVVPPPAQPPASPPPPSAPAEPAKPPRPTRFSLSDGPTPVVEFRDDSGRVIASAVPFGGYTGPVNLAAGDVNGDGVTDVAIAAGEGGGPRVRVLDGATGQQIANMMAYAPDFRGGVNVALADVTGDGRADIVTGAGTGGGPHVKVFDGRTGEVVQEFMAYDPGFRGGVGVAAVDLDGDGKAEVLTGAGVGGGPVVKVFDPQTGVERQAVYAAPPTSRNGVDLSIALDPVGGTIITPISAAEGDEPMARFHSQLRAGDPLLVSLAEDNPARPA